MDTLKESFKTLGTSKLSKIKVLSRLPLALILN